MIIFCISVAFYSDRVWAASRFRGTHKNLVIDDSVPHKFSVYRRFLSVKLTNDRSQRAENVTNFRFVPNAIDRCRVLNERREGNTERESKRYCDYVRIQIAY